MSEYVPTTCEVETAFHEFASELERNQPGTYEHAPEFVDWREAMAGFQRWLAEHDRQTAEQAWARGHQEGINDHCDADDCDISRSNPYRQEQPDEH